MKDCGVSGKELIKKHAISSRQQMKNCGISCTQLMKCSISSGYLVKMMSLKDTQSEGVCYQQQIADEKVC